MTLLLKNLLFTVLVPGTVGVYAPLLIVRDHSLGSGAALVGGVAVLALGGVVYVWCVWDFATFGRGTPAPVDAPKRLVVRGLYRYTRNPMYLGVLMLILGWTVLFRAAILLPYAFLVAVVFHLFIVLYEERKLRAEFGAEYVVYCQRVGRWLPRLRHDLPV